MINDDDEESLLSYGVAVALGVTKMSPQVKNIKIRKVNIKSKTVSRSSEIGKLLDLKVKLHVNTDVKPVTLPHRRIPFHLRGKVEEELK